MKIAVTFENGQIFQHFGHTEQFKMYKIENNTIVNTKIVNTMGNGHGALASFLKNNNVDIIICGGIGIGAKNALSQAGIKLYGGVEGSADDAVCRLLNDTLIYNPDIKCSNHNQQHNHKHSNDCNGHSCGYHSCGI
ncbi:MAG: NifB/NifX family molybdenum-iron cluster-binding protein [Acutalibacteraceae bacterium]|nr:NifB/NifX family molybdenum-iron cluster-binding protein [Acutalibacteraceae bacterium]